MLRSDGRAGHHPRLGWRRMPEEPIEQELNAEVVHATAEEHGRSLARKHGLIFKALAGKFEHLQFLCDLEVSCVVQSLANLRIVQATDRYGRTVLSAHRALEQMKLLRA